MAHLWAEVGALQYSTHKFSKIQESLQNSWRQRGDTNQSPYRRSTNISAAVKKNYSTWRPAVRDLCTPAILPGLGMREVCT